MAIAFKAAGTADETTDATGDADIQPTLPATAANDFGIMAVAHGTSANTINAVTGWNAFAQVNDGASLATRVYYRNMTGSDTDPTVVVSAPQALLGNMAVFTGVYNASPFDVSHTYTTGFGVTMSAPAVTTVSRNTMVVRLFLSDSGNATAHAAFSSGTEAFNDFSFRGNDVAISCVYAAQASPGTTGTLTADQEFTDNWVAYTLVLREPLPLEAGILQAARRRNLRAQ